MGGKNLIGVPHEVASELSGADQWRPFCINCTMILMRTRKECSDREMKSRSTKQ